MKSLSLSLRRKSCFHPGVNKTQGQESSLCTTSSQAATFVRKRRKYYLCARKGIRRTRNRKQQNSDLTQSQISPDTFSLKWFSGANNNIATHKQKIIFPWRKRGASFFNFHPVKYYLPLLSSMSWKWTWMMTYLWFKKLPYHFNVVPCDKKNYTTRTLPTGTGVDGFDKN